MNTIRFPEEEGGREAWLNWRITRVTGTRAKEVTPEQLPKEVIMANLTNLGIEFKKSAPKDELLKLLPPELVDSLYYHNDKKIGCYQLIAESWIGSQALADDENMTPIEAMNRGSLLEKESLERYRKETGRKVDDSLIGWQREDDPRIAFSPDGVTGKTGAQESKSLSAARHIEAFLTKQIPKEYWPQARQAFVVNDSLRWLDFLFYDPRFPAGLDWFYIRINRKDIKDEVAAILKEQRDTLKWVREKVAYLTQFVKVQPKQDAVHEEAMVVDEDSSGLSRVYEGIKDRQFDV